MTQRRLLYAPLQETASNSILYSKGAYNKYNDKEQWIRITEGCPNKCPFCRESFENGTEPIYHQIPTIVRNDVKIIDMNLIAKPKALDIIRYLGVRCPNDKVVYYELVCGVDYRYVTQEIADALKSARFKNIRLAWDFGFVLQKKLAAVVQMFIKAGYSSRKLTVFMICNWKTSYDDNLKKLELLKVWRVKAADCYFDNQTSPDIKPIHWTKEQIKDFRRRVRKHNQLVGFGIDPELREEGGR